MGFSLLPTGKGVAFLYFNKWRDFSAFGKRYRAAVTETAAGGGI